MDTLTISKKLIATGLKQEQAEVIAQTIKAEVKARNDELATKQDLQNATKRLEWMIGFVVVAGAAGFGYLINAINNNNDLLAVIIGKLG